MSTIFTRIINKELPGRFVWEDEHCVAFLSIGPMTPGHTLVVPRQEIDKWTDASPELIQHLTGVAQTIGTAQIGAFKATRAGLMIAGYEVPHLHVHVWPSNSLDDFDLGAVDNNPDPEDLDAAAKTLREALLSAGHADNVPDHN